MYKSSLITIIWLCILSFIPDQASAQTHQAASSSNKGFNVPEELLTTWELDEAASMEYAKKSAHWNEHIANLMPKLIATNKQIKYRFNQDEMVTIQAAKEHELDLVICIAAAQRRGLLDENEATRQGKDANNIAEGFRISGLGQLIEMGIQADRTITFGD